MVGVVIALSPFPRERTVHEMCTEYYITYHRVVVHKGGSVRMNDINGRVSLRAVTQS